MKESLRRNMVSCSLLAILTLLCIFNSARANVFYGDRGDFMWPAAIEENLVYTSNEALDQKHDYAYDRSLVQPEERLFKSNNITGNVLTALTLWEAPQRALTFIVNYGVAYIAVQLMWLTMHFLFWDYSQTLPQEEISLQAIRGYLASTDTAIVNQLAAWGTTLFISMMFLIPPVVLNLFPTLLTRRRKRRSVPAFTEADFGTAFRNLLCPLCVVRLITFNTVIYVATFVFWSLVPYLRNSVTGGNSAAGRRRRRDLEALVAGDPGVNSNPLMAEKDAIDAEMSRVSQELLNARAKYENNEEVP